MPARSPIRDDAAKARARAMWALGDYDRVAGDVLAPFATELIDACAIGRGVRVLDVAAGTGNVAIPAAAAGAEVVACDLTPALLDVGRARAAGRGVDLEWVEGDAEALPFADAAFDVVTSSVGAMFAPDHEAVARELLRVCRPGGLIGLINWPPDSWSAAFFGVLAPYGPPPDPDAPAPVLWGDEPHVRALFGPGSAELTATPGALVVDHFTDPAAMCRYYRDNFGPVIATYAALADDPERRAALDRDLLAFAERTNRGAPGGPAVYRYDYVRLVARRR
jgi:SAM-dependent methyltransferase